MIMILLLILIKIFLYLWYLYLPQGHPSIICSFGQGRLGNQLSSLATLLSFSQKFHLVPVITMEQSRLLNFYFELELPENSTKIQVLEQNFDQYFTSVFGRRLCRLWWDTPWEQVDKVNNNFNYSNLNNPDLHHGRALNVGDFPNEVKLYKFHLPELKKMFRLQSKFRDNAQIRLQKTVTDRKLGPNVTWVGVHNRRGDYGHHLQALYNLPLLTEEYFQDAMKYFRDKYNKLFDHLVMFVVVTDDMNWARHHLAGPDVVFLGNSKVLAKDTSHPLAVGRDIGEDLAMLAACNHSILSYGTFGQWGALLAGGEVVISKTASGTKEGRELREAGLLGGEDGWMVL